MSGGPVRARDGTMSLMVAGADATSSAGSRCCSAGRRRCSASAPGRRRRAHQARQQPAGGDQPDGRQPRCWRWPRAGAGPGAHARRDRKLQRPELDRQRPPAPRAGRRRRAAAHMTLLAKDSALAWTRPRRSGAQAPVGAAASAGFAQAVAQGLRERTIRRCTAGCCSRRRADQGAGRTGKRTVNSAPGVDAPVRGGHRPR
jgi:putative dehydrogenase